eukprot:5327081-Pyramimonas_sp.AAC.1
MLHAVRMVNADGQIAVSADAGTFENIPLTQQHPFMCDECPCSWIFQQHPSPEEARVYTNVFTSMTRD